MKKQKVIQMSENFEDYANVINIGVNGDEPQLVRIRTEGHTFAHIVVQRVKGDEGVWNLSVYQVSADDERKLVKWIPGLCEE